MKPIILLTIAVLGALVAPPAGARAGDNVVKVFVLAGQSNMVGMAKSALWDYQATAPGTADLFAHLRRDGEWVVRDDAFIRFGKQHGGLTLGYGARNCTGVELEFGTVVANHFDEPVLIIKTAWGGRALAKAFRPPSAGMPSDAKLKEEHAAAVRRVKRSNERQNRSNPLPTYESITDWYGNCYRQMFDEVRDTQADYETLFPALAGKRLEFAGFVWFQGWNDKYNGAEKQYAENLRCLINDVRQELQAPGLPVVVAAMGQNGSRPATGTTLAIQEAQLAIEQRSEFRGNVKAVRTDVLVDKAAEKFFPKSRENKAEWAKVGSNRPYHYLGSAIWHKRIGHAMGEAMLTLMAGESPDE